MKTYQIMAAVLSLLLTGIMLGATVDPPMSLVLAHLLGMLASIRLFLSLELGAKLVELWLSLRELGRRLPLLRRAWMARRWVGQRPLRQVAMHCAVALTTILLTFTSLDVGTVATSIA